MASNVNKDLFIITNVEHNKFYEELKERTHFDTDKRIKFVGTVYDKDLLKYIRENAYGYIHGHSVGGTNPSLLEALADTKLNLLYGVGFNKEVGEDGALYWSKTPGFLKELLEKSNQLSATQIDNLGKKAQQRVVEEYSWNKIVDDYEKSFLEN
jgi:rhamnosyltransferase